MSADDRPGVARTSHGGMSPRTINQWLKVVLLGDARVGKTSLIKALKNNASSMNRSTEYKPTTGAWITYYDVRDSCRLLITDASGRQEFTSLVNLYLRNLNCVVFVFSLDEPSSFQGLVTWYERFAQTYKGDPFKVAKFVVGTKVDTAQDSAALQAKAKSFAEEIGAEMWITSARKSFNTHELFTRIAENAEKMPCPSNEQVVSAQNDIQDGKAGHLHSHMLDNVLIGKGALVRYPDPILLDTDGEKISEILLTHQCLTMTGQKRTFKWGTSSKERADESLMTESSKASYGPRGKLWSCVMANAPPSTWQYENLEGVIKYGTLIRRQPTKAGFKGTNKLLFTSRDKLDCERNHGLFYMLLSTEDGLSEIGLNSVLDKMCKTTSSEQVVVHNDFHFKPARVSGKVASFSLSCSHAAIVVSDDNRVSTWGHGENGALGLEQHIIPNFNPRSPTPVPSINCQIKQVACGTDFTLMLTTAGSVYSCGSGAFGKLGHGDKEDKILPTLIQALQNMEATHIAAGGDHAAAIISRGYLYQWGQECADEQLTRFVATPTRVRQIDNITVTSISCGKHHSVLTGHGRVYSGIPYAWGRGSNGRLGLKNCRNVFTPVCIYEIYQAGEVVTQVSAGMKHTAFLTKDGQVYTCGSNAFGQLGYFTARGYSDVPRKVFLGKNAAGDENRAEELCCNEDYTMVLTREADVVVWGKCYYGTKLEDPIPIDPNTKKDVIIRDVTTCNLPTGDSFVELVVALTTDSNLMVCAGVKLDSDCQAADDTTPLITCINTNLTTLSCVESVLVSMDEQGNAYYADLGSWVHQFLSPPTEGHNIPDNGLIHALMSNMKEQPEPSNLPPVEFVALSAFRGSAMAIEATLSSFLFCSSIGDVYSWIPVVGGHLTHHKELNSEIIVQIACGANHFAALSSEGMLFTCGDGSSGQLGNGIFKGTHQFQMVPLSEFETVKTVCCGWASTSIITENGKVYFWGQMDVPRREKTERKQSTMPSPSAPLDFAPRINQPRKPCLTPSEYKVKIRSDVGILKHHLAIVGTALEIEIIPRDASIDSGSCMEFRAETYSVQVPGQIHSKGIIKRSKTTEGAYVASIVLLSEGSFNLFITRNGQNVLGSPLRLNAEKGVMMQRCKLSLIGSDIECLRAVGGVLQKAINYSKSSHISLWGVPSITADLPTQEALQLASMTDGAIYIYLWDANCGNLPEENFTFWLHQVSLFAPSSNVILLGVNLSATYANEIDLNPFQKVNPMLKRSIFAGTTFAAEPRNLLDEVMLVIQESSSIQRHVWSRFELLASKVEEKKKDRVEILDETAFKCLAGECDIQGESLYREAAEHLVMTGMALVIPGESLFLILQPYWLARHLAEMAKSSNSGAIDRDVLDMPKCQVASLLTSRRLALESMDSSTIYIVPYLSVMPEEIWSFVDESRYTIYRHLILTVPPYKLHSIFPNIAASVLEEFSRVFLGRYSLAIYNDEYQSRIDFGPCMINKSIAEMRLTVRANSQDMCSRGAEATVSFLQRCCENLRSSLEVSIKSSCRVCRQYYVDFCDVQEAEARGDMMLSCGRCHAKNVLVDDSLNGFKETRAAVELNWKSFHGLQETGSPHSTPSIQATDALLRPLMRYFGDREERLEAKLLKEIKGMFENMIKVFADMKNYDVPRTVCLLPEFQRTSILKANAIKMLLTFGQPKFRLFLLCEGNGDGTGVHFLDCKKHRGYRLEGSVADGLIKECADTLRFTLKLLLSWSSIHKLALDVGLFDVEDVENTVSNLLGVVGLSGTMLCAVSWTKVFKGMDDFLKGFQESASSVCQPKDLGEFSGVGVGHQLGGEKYEYLRKQLLALGTKDDFGGLRQEPRDGIGAIWVCEKHRMYGKDTTSLRVMP